MIGSPKIVSGLHMPPTQLSTVHFEAVVFTSNLSAIHCKKGSA